MKKTARGMFLLVICFMLVLSACGSGGNKNNSNKNSNTNTGTENNSSQSTNESDRKIEEITVAFPVISADQENFKLVEDAINEISEKKIQTRVKFMPINAGEWLQRTNLIFSSQEKVDLTYVNGGMYSNMVARGMLIPLDQLIEQYGSGIKASLDEKYLNATKINGEIFSVPSVRDLAGSYGLTMRKDLVEKHGIDLSAIKTLDDVGNVLQLIKDKEPGIVPLVPGGAGQSFRDSYIFFDPLGDHMGVLPNYDNDLKVVNLFEMPEYKEFVNRIREWYKNGYILNDAATNKVSTFDLIGSGKAFSYTAIQKPGFAEQETKSIGTEMVTVELLPPYITTSNVTAATWGIPVHSKLQDRAMQFLNLMHEDADIVNLFSWGVEGAHYVKVDGQDNIITYPEGKDAMTVGYNSLAWMFGNQFLTYIMQGNNPDIWKVTEEFNNTATPSKALGFVFDSSAVKTEYAAVQNVITQYKLPIETGSVDPDKHLPEFIEKLKEAGIDKVIAEKQKQLDEWAKANSVK